MPIPREELRLSAAELDTILRSARTMRVATVSPGCEPHVAPLWFLWHGDAVWINSLRRSRRMRDLAAGSAVACCVDVGERYEELRGVVLYGRFEDASGRVELGDVRRAYGEKYWDGIEVPELRSHLWLRLVPERTASWDFRKIPRGRDRRIEARRGHD